jgi:two-component system, NtrC family, sensor kinase
MIKQLLIILLITMCGFASAQDTSSAMHLDKLPSEGVLLVKGWKFHPGDNPAWADAGFNDSEWESVDPTL